MCLLCVQVDISLIQIALQLTQGKKCFACNEEDREVRSCGGGSDVGDCRCVCACVCVCVCVCVDVCIGPLLFGNICLIY